MKNKLYTIIILFLVFLHFQVNVFAAKVKVACVGNSITAGYLLNSSQAYPTVLQSLLGSDYEVKNFGVSGTTYLVNTGDDWSYWGKNGKMSDVVNYAPNIIIVELGTNDSKSSYSSLREPLGDDIEKMIVKFKALPSKPIIYICIPPPAFNTNFDIQPTVLLNEVTAAISQAAQNQNVQLIDLYDPIKNHAELFIDGIHPSATGAKHIASFVNAAITATNIAVTGINISSNAALIAVGNSIAITVTVAPDNATNKIVTWSSSNTNVATVNSSGLVTGIDAGSSVITVMAGDGGIVAACELTVTSPTSGLSGNVTAEFWTEITGTAIPNMPATAANTSSTFTSLEIPINVMDNYLVRIRGYIVPSTTGTYNFYIASDDNGELWLSTNNLPANISRIAYHTAWTDSRQWEKYATQKSAAISLTAGTRYYFEAIMKEFDGGDNLAIGWTGPGVSAITVIGSANLDKYIAGDHVSVANVTLNPTSALLEVNENIQLIANVLPGNSTNQSINWSSSDPAIAAVNTTGMVTGKAAGTATITVTTVDGSIKATCVITVNNLVGISENSLNDLVSVYPNPTTDFVTIDFGNSLDNSVARIQIVDLLGKEVYQSGKVSQTSVLQINTSQFSKGVYIVNITVGTEKVCKKLVIH